MEVTVIADDLTGAADSGIQFTRAGYRTAVAFRGAPVPPSRGLDAVVVDTDSRLLSPQEARERVREAGEALKGARIVYKKIDSTLRGPIAAELAAALEAAGRSRAVVAPAFPGAGRSTREGVQLVRGEPVHETGLADDPRTPVREGYIPSVLAGEGLEAIATLGVGDLAHPDLVRRVLEDSRWIVVDAEKDAHLGALVRSIPDPAGVLWTGSAGLARALGGAYPGPRAGTAPEDPSGTVRNVLAVVGSTNEVAREQMERLREAGVVLVALDSLSAVRGDSGEAVRKTREEVRAALGDGRSVALYSTDEEIPAHDAPRVVEALAEVTVRLSEEGSFDALVLTGGDTAVHVACSLGARGILLEEEIEMGVPVGTLLGPNPYRIVTKAGGFGSPRTLINALRTLTGKE